MPVSRGSVGATASARRGTEANTSDSEPDSPGFGNLTSPGPAVTRSQVATVARVTRVRRVGPTLGPEASDSDLAGVAGPQAAGGPDHHDAMMIPSQPRQRP